MKKTLRFLCSIGVLGLALSGCLLTAEQEYKDALPEESDLKIVMGGADSEAAGIPSDCEECCVDEKTGEYIDSDTYSMTRAATYHVNGTLATVFVWFRYIVSQPYSTKLDNGYIWGPWDDTDIDPLSRIAYRFVMTKNADSSFDFGLEVALINDQDGKWTPYIYGNALPTGEPHKGMGVMTIDFDVIHDLDSAHPSNYHGQVAYDFDVRQVSPTEASPNTVVTTFKDFWEEPGFGQEKPEPLNADYTYERYEDLSGKLAFIASFDFTGPKNEPDEIKETFNVESRWNEEGKGKGEASISGGSIEKMNIDTYSLIECWAETTYYYYETYDIETITYTDGTPPLEEQNCGDSSHCPIF